MAPRQATRSLLDPSPSRAERAAAGRLRRILLDEGPSGTVDLTNADGARRVELGPALSRLLVDVLTHVERGEAVAVVPVERALTTQEAADILGVSRPHVVQLLRKEEFPFHLVGRHRRVLARDVFTYKRRRDATRDAAMTDLAAIDAELI